MLKHAEFDGPKKSGNDSIRKQTSDVPLKFKRKSMQIESNLYIAIVTVQ